MKSKFNHDIKVNLQPVKKISAPKVEIYKLTAPSQDSPQFMRTVTTEDQRIMNFTLSGQGMMKPRLDKKGTENVSKGF